VIADTAYQGARGAFSEEAARALLGPSAALLPCRTLADVFQALAAGQVETAVIPTVNSIVGPVPDAAELMATHRVTIVAKHDQPIDQSVIAPPGASLQGLRVVWSHPVALGQCGRWLKRRSWIQPNAAFDTAGAVAEVIDRGCCAHAAIASRCAADVYGGAILAERIQDRADNVTRFVLVRTEAAFGSIRDDSQGSPLTRYLDSSSLVELYIDEPGSDIVGPPRVV
jgi:prephenate dehydratase